MSAIPTCGACGRLMRIATGCALTQLEDRARVPYGYEDPDPAAPARDAPCQSCAVVSGQFHHWDCRAARCRGCGSREHVGPCRQG